MKTKIFEEKIKAFFKPNYKVIKIANFNVCKEKQINKQPELFWKTKKFEEKIKFSGDRLNWKKDWIIMASIMIIFGVISFLILTVLLNGFNFNLRVFSLRIWQVLLGAFGGGALGVAGLLLQKMTKNNLADVSVLGIGSLNIIFVALYIFSSYQANDTQFFRDYLPLVTIASSILGTSIIYFIAKLGGKNTDRFIIIGIALQFLFEAISLAIISPKATSAPGDVLQAIRNEVTNFTLGKFPDLNLLATNYNWRFATFASAVGISLIVGIAWLLRKKIDLIETNENLAIAYGVRVERLRLMLYFFVALLAGIEASMIGTIALLGILAPNIAKGIFGNKSNTNILASFLIGAILVLFATFISVNLQTNIPIGFLATTIIAPYFLYMILKRKH